MTLRMVKAFQRGFAERVTSMRNGDRRRDVAAHRPSMAALHFPGLPVPIVERAARGGSADLSNYVSGLSSNKACPQVDQPPSRVSFDQAVLIADLVESVRIMCEDQAGTVRRWLLLKSYVLSIVVTQCRGRLVESRGDSLVLAFPNGKEAVKAALQMHRYIATINADVSQSLQFQFRMGIHKGELFGGEHEVLGNTVNVAARLHESNIARPGDIVISEEVFGELRGITGRERRLVCQMDVQYLGSLQLRNFDEPIRAYRLFIGNKAGVEIRNAEALNSEPYALTTWQVAF